MRDAIGKTALVKAKEIAGGASALAERLALKDIHITPQAVGQWKRVPVERVLAVEAVTGVSRHELRPDIYPREDVFGYPIA